jgi:hypothetical protein
LHRRCASVVDVWAQLRDLDQSATLLFLSVGGNDALNASGVFAEVVRTVAGAADRLAVIQARFRDEYQQLLDELIALGKPLGVCTIYDAVPGLGEEERTP